MSTLLVGKGGNSQQNMAKYIGKHSEEPGGDSPQRMAEHGKLLASGTLDLAEGPGEVKGGTAPRPRARSGMMR